MSSVYACGIYAVSMQSSEKAAYMPVAFTL